MSYSQMLTVLIIIYFYVFICRNNNILTLNCTTSKSWI
jgi:hypothetical protein